MQLYEASVYKLYEVRHATVKSLSPDTFLSIFLNMMKMAAPPITAMKINFRQVFTRMLACFPVKSQKDVLSPRAFNPIFIFFVYFQDVH